MVARTSLARSRPAWATSARATFRSFNRPKSTSRLRSRRKENFSKPSKASAWEPSEEGSDEKCKVERYWPSLLRDYQQRHRRPENAGGSALDPPQQRPVARLGVHHSDAHQQHGQRPGLDGIRTAGS